MSAHDRLQKVFQTSPRIACDNQSKIVFISDCHRGDDSWADNFAKNQNLYFSALTHYYREGYTYIELGDGDELWENKQLSQIMEVHSNVFWLMSKFYRENRLYLLYGNHDMVKRNKKQQCCMCSYYDVRSRSQAPLCPKICFYEGLVLHYVPTDDEIFLVHGHQADFLNYTLWRLARFLVRYVWKPLEIIGIQNPTAAAKNYKTRDMVERKLIEWVQVEGHMMIAGHTHRPVFPHAGEPLYFNDGSCVHPRCITGIELNAGSISLIKWAYKTRLDGTVYVGRETLAGPASLDSFLHNKAIADAVL